MTAFLVNIVIDVPAGAAQDEVDQLIAQERRRAAELAESGTIERLWRDPARWANWGIWHGDDRRAVDAALDSLPLRRFMTISVTELEPHPSDPGALAR